MALIEKKLLLGPLATVYCQCIQHLRKTKMAQKLQKSVTIIRRYRDGRVFCGPQWSAIVRVTRQSTSAKCSCGHRYTSSCMLDHGHSGHTGQTAGLGGSTCHSPCGWSAQMHIVSAEVSHIERYVIPFRLFLASKRSDSGVTRVGVTRGGNWWRHPIFSWKTRNSSGDEIANVNFLCDDIVHALKIQ